jgi:hypothetical protein
VDTEPIASRAEICTLFERANAALEHLLHGDDDDDDGGDRASVRREQRAVLRGVMEALRFCCMAAADLGDPELVGLVAQAIRISEPFDPHADGDQAVMVAALTRLLRAGAPVDKHIVALASHRTSSLRHAVAAGLRPGSGAATALLETLAADAAPNVREVAKKTLAQVREVAWWVGKFASDPSPRLLPGEAERCGPALARLAALLDLPRYKLYREPESLASAVSDLAALPDVLAVDLLELLFRTLEVHYLGLAGPLVAHLLARPEGPAAFARLVEHWSADSDFALLADHQLTLVLKAAPAAARRELCPKLLSQAAATPYAVRIDFDRAPLLPASLLAHAWPPGEDPSPVLDQVLRFAEEGLDYGAAGIGRRQTDFVMGALCELFANAEIDFGPVLDRIAEARASGHPGAWSVMGHRTDLVLARAEPAVLRRVAERGLASDDPLTIVWALSHLLGGAFDPEKDGDRSERVRVLAAQPGLRAAILQNDALACRALAALRGQLRGGELDYPAAARVLEVIGQVFGGAAPAGDLPGETKAAEARRAKLAELSPWLGPEALRGPLTAEESARLREARAAYTPEDDKDRARHWSKALQPGPWTSLELADLDELLERFRAGSRSMAFWLAAALAAKPDAALLPRFDEVVAGCDAGDRSHLAYLRGETRTALGLPPRPPRRPAAAGGDLPAGEWNDDSDD